VTTAIPQANWNIDKGDGTGPSGITLDTSRAQIFWIDFEWLGVGRVRFGIFYHGVPIPLHQINFANEVGSTSVYMSTPALPLSLEIENDGTGQAATLECICSSVLSEGGQLLQGAARSVSRGNTGLAISNAALVPLISIRAKDGLDCQTINIIGINAVTTTNNAVFRWALVLNPTITAPDDPVWVPVPNSSVEYSTARTQANGITDGTFIEEGYVSNDVRGVAIRPSSFIGIGKRLLASSPRDQFVLAVQNISGANNTYFGALQFEESV
jgi:hypothetical protein